MTEAGVMQSVHTLHDIPHHFKASKQGLRLSMSEQERRVRLPGALNRKIFAWHRYHHACGRVHKFNREDVVAADELNNILAPDQLLRRLCFALEASRPVAIRPW